MGRRPRDTEGVGPGLAEDEARNLRKLAADLFDQLLARERVRFASALPLFQQRLDSRSGGSDQPRRAIVEPAALRFAGVVPGKATAASPSTSEAGPPPNGSTSRNAWRTLARREMASA